MVTKAGGYIHISICMMDQVKTPEKWNLMHGKVYQPAAEIKRQYSDQNSYAHIGIEPINHSKLLVPAPVGERNNKYGQESVNDQMNTGKNKIHAGMAKFVFSVMHG